MSGTRARCGPADGRSPPPPASAPRTGSHSAVRPPADPTPDHGIPQRPLRRVVRRLDPPNPREAPQPLFHLEDLEARRRRLAHAHRRPLLQGLSDLPPQAAHPLWKRLPRQRPVPHPVPVAEQAVRHPQQPSPTARRHRRDRSSPENRGADAPTDLSPERRDPLVGAEPIARDDLAGLAPQQRLGHSPARVPAIVKTVANAVTVTHSQPCAVLSPRRLSMWTSSASWTETASPL